MNRIIPHLWYDKEAREAAELYVSVIPDSSIRKVNTIRNTPSGDCDIVSFELAGQNFMAISAGPLFKFTPAISFQVRCSSFREVDAMWGKLSKNGSVMMELGAYQFSERFGWCADRFGLSWQIMHAPASEIGQRITPFLMFVGANCGKAEEASHFYTSVFHNSKFTVQARHGKNGAPEKEGTIQYGRVTLEHMEFAVMDSALPHPFALNEAISFLVNCESQKEIDYYSGKLSSVPEAEVCGWVKDRYGVSWQISPAVLDTMLSDKDPQRVDRVTEAFLQMKRFDLKKLQDVFDGK
jgi:predicted 3-demethylubiquinone-9 3-methyltransferase (glyoxalase superfamily)